MTEYVGTRISAQVRSHAQKVLSDYSIAARAPTQSDGIDASENLSSKHSQKNSSSQDVTLIYAHNFVEP